MPPVVIASSQSVLAASQIISPKPAKTEVQGGELQVVYIGSTILCLLQIKASINNRETTRTTAATAELPIAADPKKKKTKIKKCDII